MARTAGATALCLCFFSAFHAGAQAFRSQFTQIRATVPVGSTNVTILGGSSNTNNTIILVNGAASASFDVSGLPAGAAAVFTDAFGDPLPSTTQSTNLAIVLYTTNIPEGIYNFTLNIGGLDTNGLPVTNQFPFVLQAAHIWLGNGLGAGAFGFSNNWATATNWLGGPPAATDDVVVADYGAQTNANTYGLGTVPDIGIDSSTMVASLRFAQNTFTNTVATNALLHSIRIANGVTLSVTGTNAQGGFSLLRDTIAEFGFSPDSSMGVVVYGTNGTLLVNNTNASFSVLPNASENPTMNFSNLGTFSCTAARVAIADYRAYPNYLALNAAFNAGRDTNTYAGIPRRMWATVNLARTNLIKATFVDPGNYTNEFTRTYALTVQNNEQAGNGSSVNTYLNLGRTNVFYLDSINFIGSSSASGNGGGAKFSPYVEKPAATNPGVLFRNADGVSRMSMFAVSDDGGTNEANSNVKSTTDFSYGNFSGTGSGSGYINLLVDRLYVARDRTMIASNQTPNVQGDLIIGGGIVDANTVYLGCQEHSNKVDWTALYGAAAYLNYCEGRLVITNSPYSASTFRINRTLTLGYTADRNAVASAQQYNTYGQVTLYSNVTFLVSNVVCDGGLNFYDAHGRNNTFTINRGGNLVISNSMGYPSDGASDFSAADPKGIRLDSLTMNAGTLTVFADPSRANVYTRTFTTPGIIPSVIKVAALNNVTSFPADIPLISYEGQTAPFLNADVSALGGQFHGYILNNVPNNSVDLYLTTNAPNNLIWTGAASSHWNTNDLNWVVAGTGTVTNFHLGDTVTFNDSSTVTNVTVDDAEVPGQTGTGVTISNTVNQYVFSAGGDNQGTIAGTALVVKQGTNSLEFDAAEQGPILLMGGVVTGGGQLGTTTVYSNVVLNYTGFINGGLTSTGMVTFAGTEQGPISIQGGTLDNYGTMSTTINQVIAMAGGTAITNESGSTINVGALPVNSSLVFDVPNGSTLVNYGTLNLWQPKMTVEGLLYGTGTISYPNGGGYDSIANTSDPRLVIGPQGLLSPGSSPYGVIGSMKLYCRFDFNNDPSGGQGVAGVGTVRIEVDFSDPNVNDVINCDRWNNDTGYLLMTNINPGAGSFALGQTFQIFNNTSGSSYNYIDTLGFCPTIMPYVPGPGLQWGVGNFNQYGSVSVTKSPNQWDGVSSSNWSTNTADTSWKTGQFFTDNQGAVFDDSASGSTTVNLAGNVAPESYTTITVTNTDNLTYTNIIITTNQPAIYPGIVVSNALKDYVITGPGHIRGITGLYKTGPGTLTLMTSNDFIGNVIVDNGTLVVTNFGVLPNIVSLGIAGGGQMENDVILDGGTLYYVGTTNVNLSNGKNTCAIFNPGGGTIGVASPTNMLSMNKSATGAGSLTKVGPGALQMTSTLDNYFGNTIINAGTVQLTAAAVGYGAVMLNNTSVLQLTNNFTLTNAIVAAGPAASLQVLGGSTNVLSGPWSGAGTVTVSNGAVLIFTADLSGFSGLLSFGASTGQFQFNNVTNKNPSLGSAAATFDLGTSSAILQNFNGSNLTYNLGALSGGPNTVLAGRSTNSASPPGTIYSIGANSLSTTFAGHITNGADTVSLVKVGQGTLWLNGASSYTGPTTVSSGTLGGTGSIASPLTITAGGTLAPGASPALVGTFTVSNNVTLTGTTLIKLNRAGTQANDMVAVTGTLSGGGTLVVTNIGPDINNGTKFTLFSKPITGFANVVLPANNPANNKAYSWNNTLSADGSITLVSGGGINPNPTNIVVAVTNGILSLSWPSDHTGWRLEVQTNPLTSGLGNNWYAVPDSTNVNMETIPMDAAQGSIFYRLVLP